GLAVALAECTFDSGGVGADISIESVGVARDVDVNRAAALFGESASRVVLSVAPESAPAVLKRASLAGVPARLIGRTGGQNIRIAVGGQIAVDVAVPDAEQVWSDAIAHYFARQV